MKQIQYKDTDSQDIEALPVTKDPISGKMVCCCNYELVKYDKNLWRCTGGSHMYYFDEENIEYDCFGNQIMRPASESDKEKSNADSE